MKSDNSPRMVERLVDSAMCHGQRAARAPVVWFEDSDTDAEIERVHEEAESVIMQGMEAIHGIGAAFHAASSGDIRPLGEFAGDVGTAVVLIAELVQSAVQIEHAAILAKEARRRAKLSDGCTEPGGAS